LGAGTRLGVTHLQTKPMSPESPFRGLVFASSTARAPGAADDDDARDDRHERGAHSRCGAKNPRASVRGDERVRAGATTATRRPIDARPAILKLRARAVTVRRAMTTRATVCTRARTTSDAMYFRASFRAQVLDFKSADDAYRCGERMRAVETVKSRLKLRRSRAEGDDDARGLVDARTGR